MHSFFRFQSSSIISTVSDYALTIVLTELTPVTYIVASALGQITGGMVNFSINRNWVFPHGGRRRSVAGLLYAAVWLISLLLNTLGLFLLTEYPGLDYRISKAITALLVGVAWNYNAQKRIVFAVRQQ